LQCIEPENGVRLINIRNPWGEGEWKGKFADNDAAWTASLKKKVNPKFANDGSFWMEWNDFIRVYSSMTVVPLLTDSIGTVWNKTIIKVCC
jgi:hypothetical protein